MKQGKLYRCKKGFVLQDRQNGSYRHADLYKNNIVMYCGLAEKAEAYLEQYYVLAPSGIFLYYDANSYIAENSERYFREIIML